MNPQAMLVSAHADDALGAHETAAHSTALAPGEVPSKVHLLPLGTFRGRDGRGPYTLASVEQAREVIATTEAYLDGQPLPIDYDHQLEHTEQNGAGAPASGWVTALEARPDGIWGAVEWTPAATEKIRAKEYRYLSPVFAYEKSGEVLAVIRAGLTNKPNLTLTAINSRSTTTTTTKSHEGTMTKLSGTLALIAAAVGLPDTSDEATVLTSVNTMRDAEAGHRTQLTALREKLKLGVDAKADAILVAAQAAAVDPSKFVAMAQYNAVSEQLRSLQSKLGEQQVDAAIAAGKIIPAQREWALSYHASNPEGFATFVEKQPVVVAAGTEQRERPAPSDSKKLNDAERAVAAQLGIPEADVLKAKAALAGSSSSN